VAEGYVAGQPRAWLRAEGLLTLAAAATLYALADAPWLWFALLFMAPDVSILGYLAGPKVGAALYNVMHSYVGPFAATLTLWLLNEHVSLALIWFAHIAFDRALGFGLKYPSTFWSTHMGLIGKSPEP
jgi:hypothetical protein